MTTAARRRLGRLTLLPIPTPAAAVCPGCGGRMVASGRFAIEVEGRGQLCNQCLEPYVPAGLARLAHALDLVAERLEQVEPRAASTARRFIVDACLVLAAPPPPPATHSPEQPSAGHLATSGAAEAGTEALRRSA